MRSLLAGTTAAFLVVSPVAGSAGWRTAFLLLGAITLAVLAYRERRLLAGAIPRAVAAAWVAWAIVAGASLAWSVNPRYTLGEFRSEVLYGGLAFAVFYLGARLVRREVWHGAVLAGAAGVLALQVLDAVVPFSLTRHEALGQGGMWSTYLVLVAPFVLAIGWPGFWQGRHGLVVQCVALALLLGAAWDTGNRMVWLALAVELAVAMAFAQKAFSEEVVRNLRRVVLAGIVVVTAAFILAVQDRVDVALPGNSISTGLAIDVRPRIWAAAWEQFLQAPWLGHGFGREIVAAGFNGVAVPPNHPPVLHAHNLFMQMALQLGIVGLAAFLALLVALVRQYLACFRDPGTLPFGVLGLTLLAGFLVKNQTDYFFHRHNALVFWALNGMLLGFIRPAAWGIAFERSSLGALVPPPSGKTADFTCNLCGEVNRGVPLPAVENRETPSCRRCGSTLRVRAILYLLSKELYGRPAPLVDFPVDRRISGVGLSDWEGYADPLSRKLAYKNTYYHREPRLDITQVPERECGRHRFVIASDVFEHIPHHGLDEGLRNLRRLLAPGGFLIFTVPYRKEGETVEYFPRLHEFRIDMSGARPRLINTTVDGQEEVFEDLDIHGGAGVTVAMRFFGESDVLRRLAAAGFSSVSVHGDHFSEYGILWPMDHSLPIVARA